MVGFPELLPGCGDRVAMLSKIGNDQHNPSALCTGMEQIG